MGKHLTSVDQSDRRVPYNLRQSGATPAEMLISPVSENLHFGIYPCRRGVGGRRCITEFIILLVMFVPKTAARWLNTWL